jgi:phage terminase large subunit GpA-like protein
MGEEGAIQAGLEKLVSDLLGRDWQKAGGGLARIDRLFVDMGYKPGVVAAVKHKVGGSAMMLSKGVGIRAGGKPVSMYQRRPGWTLGTNWYVPNVRGTAEFPHICIDVNSWKSFVHERLAVAPGDPGALTLFGKKAAEHHLFGEHIAGSETYVTTFGHGRQVHQWRQRPERPDNHSFNCLVGCAAAVSREGCVLFGTEGQPGRRRERVRLSDLQRGRG